MTVSPRAWSQLANHVRRHVKGQFELDPTLIHLNAMLVASPPKRVREAIRIHREAIDKNPAGHILERIGVKRERRAVQQAARVADNAAKYLGLGKFLKANNLTGTSVIAQTTSTTMGLALLANGIAARPGQEVLLSIHEFFAWRESWQSRCARSDLRYREIRLFRDPTTDDLQQTIIEEVEGQIRENTRVLALVWVDSATGVKLPIRRIGDLVRDLNRRRAPADQIIFCVDGVHGFGVENTAFQDLHCDFLVSGCHKWLFGPRGTGIICALPEAWVLVTPTIPSFLPIPTPGAVNTPGGVQTYEYAWAVSEAFAFHRGIGKRAVEQYTYGLASLLKQGLAAIPNVRVVTPIQAALSSGIVCCDVGRHPDVVEDRLRKLGILATTSSDADDKPFLRFSPSILNDEAQIAVTLKALARIMRR
ncbi:MAG: aminotransferase class V-fold PLP-dependent enzyme [Gemmatimonadaceae bacterium]